MRMIFTAEFDRDVTNGYYLSPGGYKVELKDHEPMEFDFMDSIGTINKENPRLVDFEVKNLDYGYMMGEENVDYLRNHIRDITGFTEFFVFTGEDEDPEINFVGIKNLVIDASVDDLDETETDLFDIEMSVGEITEGDFLATYTAKPKLIDQINELIQKENN